MNQIPGLCSWLPGAVDGDLDGLVVRRNQVRVAVDHDRHSEALPATAPTHEAKVAEFGHLQGKFAINLVFSSKNCAKRLRLNENFCLNSAQLLHE